MQGFAKEFGRGVRQQRTRGKTKERPGTLPLALSMFRRNVSAHGEINLLKEVQGSEGQSTAHDAVEEYEIIFSKGDVVALKHNYKSFIIPFFLAVLSEDLHHNGDAFLEDRMSLRWLEQSDEDPLVYKTGHQNDRNSPECIIEKVEIIKDGNNFCLSHHEEQRLVALLQGSVESDDSSESSGDEARGARSGGQLFRAH